MFILLEKITPYENYFEFECFFNDIEINYSNRLFDIKAYLLVSSHKSFGNRLDAVILLDSSNFRNLEFSRKDLTFDIIFIDPPYKKGMIHQL